MSTDKTNYGLARRARIFLHCRPFNLGGGTAPVSDLFHEINKALSGLLDRKKQHE
jgi:hypothetical protein